MKQHKFVVFSAAYNCQDYIKQHIESVHYQTYKNYTHILVDDASTDNTHKTILKNIKGSKIQFHHNSINQKWIKNALAYLEAEKDDIIVLLDGDDFFSKKNVLEILNDFYNNNDCWITYSRMYYQYRKITSHWIPTYSKKDLEQKNFRNNIWSFTHLRTWKAFLWNYIDKDDLKNDMNEYFKYSYDRAIFYPMLELASPNHVGFIDDVLMIYNDENPLSVEKIHRKEQEDILNYLNKKKKYDTLIL